MKKTKIIAEIGINHNGDMDNVYKLIDGAVLAGVDIVKFQKRDLTLVYDKEYLDSYRESPWGTTQLDQKYGLELSISNYKDIDRYCKLKGIDWTWSSWDTISQSILQKFDVKYNKIASAMLTKYKLMTEIIKERKHTFISTGMANLDEIDRAVKAFRYYGCPFELMYCNSVYPNSFEDVDLNIVNTFKKRYKSDVGYSDHSAGRILPVSAVAKGSSSIEVHITLDRNMYGSDQKASLEIPELIMLVKDVRNIEKSLGSGEKTISEKELAVRKKLRG